MGSNVGVDTGPPVVGLDVGVDTGPPVVGIDVGVGTGPPMVGGVTGGDAVAVAKVALPY